MTKLFIYHQSLQKILLCNLFLFLLLQSIFWLLLWTCIIVESHVRIILLEILRVNRLTMLLLSWVSYRLWLNLNVVSFLCPHSSEILRVSTVSTSNAYSFTKNLNFCGYNFFYHVMISIERVTSLHICCVYVAFWLKAGLNMLNFNVVWSASNWFRKKSIDSSIKSYWQLNKSSLEMHELQIPQTWCDNQSGK